MFGKYLSWALSPKNTTGILITPVKNYRPNILFRKVDRI